MKKRKLKKWVKITLTVLEIFLVFAVLEGCLIYALNGYTFVL